MKRQVWMAAALIVAGSVVIVVSSRSAAAQRPFDVRSLQGTYVGGLIEVRQDPVKTGPIEYCDSAGTFTFSGKGDGTSSLTRRCSLAGTVVDKLKFTYTVTPEGVGHIKFSSGEAGRFQLALGGQVAFITAANDPDNRILVHQGHWVRQDR